jgi:sugar lactone lactonase YvrE
MKPVRIVQTRKAIASAVAIAFAAAMPALAATGPIISLTPGVVTTYAGSLSNGGGIGNGGAATSANLYLPSVSRFDGSGNLFVLDAGNNVVRKVSAAGTISAFAFTGVAGNFGDGGAATAAQLGLNARGMFVTSAGLVYVSDSTNNAIRLINASGQVSTVAGTNGTAGYTGDAASATSATLNNPGGIFVDAAGDIFIADTANNAVREVVGGVIKTIAGGPAVVCAAKTDAYGDGCPAAQATLVSPTDVTLDAAGNIYILDAGDYRVRKITVATGIITTVIGSGTSHGSSGDLGLATSATIYPYNTLVSTAPVPSGGIVVDSEGDIFLADTGNNKIRMVNAAGIINTVAGNGTAGPLGDGLGALAANLNLPQSVALDANNNLYIADTQNSRIREVNVAAGYLTAFTSTINVASGTQIVYVYNPGASALTITSFTFAGAAFSEKAGATECKPAQSLAPGATCVITALFTPTAGGESTGTITIQTNAANAASGTSVVQLVGICTSVAPTPAPSLSSTTAMTSTLPAPPSILSNVSFTLTATVTPPASSTLIPTGQVQFVSGNTSLGLVTLVGETATLTVTSMPPGEANIVAYYLGDMNFKASTGTALTVEVFPSSTPMDFGFTSTASTVTLNATVGSATFNLTAYSINGYANIVGFNCAGLPAPLTCTFTPPTTYLAPGKQSTTPVVVVVTNPAPLTQNDLRRPWGAGSGVVFALAFLGSFALRRKRGPWRVLAVLATLAILGGVSMISGCSDSVPNTIAKSGTYQITIAASDGVLNHSIPVTVIVP